MELKGTLMFIVIDIIRTPIQYDEDIRIVGQFENLNDAKIMSERLQHKYGRKTVIKTLSEKLNPLYREIY